MDNTYKKVNRTMGKNRACRLLRSFALMLIILLFLGTMPDIFALCVRVGAAGTGRNVADKIELTSLIVNFDNEVVYEMGQGHATPSVDLNPDSTMSFNLFWKVTDSEYKFRDGDYFSIPVVYANNLRLTEPFTQALTLDSGNGRDVDVAEGEFSYVKGLLSFQVVFNKKAADYRIEGGPAGGYAELNLGSGQTTLTMEFGDSQELTVEVDTTPGGITPGLPTFPGTLPSMHKAVFSPDVNGSTVNLLSRYTTMQPGSERKFGLDWRMTFFDLLSYFRESGESTENVIIEDTIGEGQEFANFAYFAPGDRDKGFNVINDEDYEAPFFIEIPIVAVGSNRIYNLHGDDTLTANSSDGYIGTIIRANQLQKVTNSDVAGQVRRQPLSWGVEKLDDGREKLIINLGKLGPGVKKGDGLTADLVKERDYPHAVLDEVIVKELLTAQRMIKEGGSDVSQWKRVRKESLDTILYYWPKYKAKLCSIAGISSLSKPAALEEALFNMTYEQLSQSDITTLGYDEKGSGGIAAAMLIDSFVLRYRTVLSSVADTEISNKVKVTTDAIAKEDNTSYRHQFYAGIFGSVNVGEIAFIKADASDGLVSGETTAEKIQNIGGLAGAEFEVYEASGGSPLRFARSGSVYSLDPGGNVTVLLSDSDGAFKITGLSPTKEYALYEKAAPTGYQLPSYRYTVFSVNSRESKYFVVTNNKKASPPDTSGKPDKSDKPNTPNTSIPPTDVPTTNIPPTDVPTTNIPPTDVPTTNIPPTDIPKMGDNSPIGVAVFLMAASAVALKSGKMD